MELFEHSGVVFLVYTFFNLGEHNLQFGDKQNGERGCEYPERGLHGCCAYLRYGRYGRHKVLYHPGLTTHFGHYPAAHRTDVNQRYGRYGSIVKPAFAFEFVTVREYSERAKRARKKHSQAYHQAERIKCRGTFGTSLCAFFSLSAGLCRSSTRIRSMKKCSFFPLRIVEFLQRQFVFQRAFFLFPSGRPGLFGLRTPGAFFVSGHYALFRITFYKVVYTRNERARCYGRKETTTCPVLPLQVRLSIYNP